MGSICSTEGVEQKTPPESVLRLSKMDISPSFTEINGSLDPQQVYDRLNEISCLMHHPDFIKFVIYVEPNCPSLRRLRNTTSLDIRIALQEAEGLFNRETVPEFPLSFYEQQYHEAPSKTPWFPDQERAEKWYKAAFTKAINLQYCLLEYLEFTSIKEKAESNKEQITAASPHYTQA
jgi:hypothetical protein